MRIVANYHNYLTNNVICSIKQAFTMKLKSPSGEKSNYIQKGSLQYHVSVQSYMGRPLCFLKFGGRSS